MKILLFSPVASNKSRDEHLFDIFDKFCIIGISVDNVTVGIIIDAVWN
jgi:hypothetical protein